jgi:hypothetical protein
MKGSADDTEGFLNLVQLAESRTEVALEAAVLAPMPPLAPHHAWLDLVANGVSRIHG